MKESMKPGGKFAYYAFPKLTALVTVLDKQNVPNIITLAWHSPVSIKPPYYGISIAPNRYSHELVLESQEFVVNFAPFSIVDKLHYCGTHSGRKVNKFKHTGLTPMRSERVKPPRIQECYAHLECKLVTYQRYGDHTWFVGEVVAVSADNALFSKRILKPGVEPVYYLGDNTYTTIGTKRLQID